MNGDNAQRTSGSGFSVTLRQSGPSVVVSVVGDLDALTAPEAASVIRAGARQQPDALIVDLSNVQFLATAGMSVLIDAHRDVVPAIRFGVVAHGPSTRRPLKLIGIDSIVAVYRTLDDALRDEH